MSDDDPKDEPVDDSEQQADEQATDSDQSAGQAEQQPVESDQTAEQTEDQAATSDESAEQSVEQPAESDQTTEQSEGQPSVESDQLAGQPDEATGGGGGGGSGGGVGGGGPADDAVPADSGSEKKRPLRVMAEFTQEGQKFIGDITIEVSEWTNGRPGNPRFPTVWFFQETHGPKGNVIDTGPLPGGVPGVEVLITAHARVPLPDQPNISRDESFQNCSRGFVIPMPSGTDVLRVKFDVEVRKVDPQTVTVDKKALDKEVPGGIEAEAAKNMVRHSPQLTGHSTFDLDATPLGNHKFRVTGKYLTGDIQSSSGRKFVP
jgi:hypothetical protein